jgi:hypothetical protein
MAVQSCPEALEGKAAATWTGEAYEGVREHSQGARTPLAAFFNTPKKGGGRSLQATEDSSKSVIFPIKGGLERMVWSKTPCTRYQHPQASDLSSRLKREIFGDIREDFPIQSKKMISPFACDDREPWGK